MAIYNVTEARKKLYHILDDVAVSHEPALITGKRSSGVLVSEDDWNALQESLYILSVPGMRQSLEEAQKEPIAESREELEW